MSEIEINDGNVGYGTAPEPSRVIWELECQDGRKEMIFQPEMALAALLIAEQVFVNSHWWHKDLPDADQKAMAVFVNCNDVFVWSCCDAEAMAYDDLRAVYEAWVKDPTWGCSVWCMQTRGQMPQSRVAKQIRSAGIWDLDAMGLRSNAYDGFCAAGAAAQREPELSMENEGGRHDDDVDA